MGSDNNNETFWLGFAVVSIENFENWKWFLENLVKVIPDIKVDSVLSSDREKGLILAAQSILPTVPHIFCLQHLKRNVNFRFKSELIVQLVEKCAYAVSFEELDARMEELKSINEAAFTYLIQIPKASWIRCYMSFNNFGVNTSNVAESMNSSIKRFKSCTYLDLCYEIICQSFRFLVKRQKKNFIGHTKYAYNLLNKGLDKSKNCRAIPFSESSCQIRQFNGYDDADKTYDVDLFTRTCDCLNFQFLRVPCSHALSAIKELNRNPVTYISDFYSAQNHVESYNYTVSPAHISSSTPLNQLLPPKFTKKIGRPKKRRVKSAGEFSRQSKRKYSCKICSGIGHNKRKCPRKE